MTYFDVCISAGNGIWRVHQDIKNKYYVNYALKAKYELTVITESMCYLENTIRREVKGLDESRSFMYIDDLISVLEKFIFEMESQDNIIFNVGSRTETLISELAIIIAKVLGINPPISPAQSFPGSVKRRLADVNLLEKYINVNETSLEDGLNKYIKWYRANS